MSEQYHVDLEQFSLEEFRLILETARLLPSQKILGEELPERFAILAAMGIGNLKESADRLSTKKKIERFAQESGLPVDYLTILRRRIGFYTPKPTPLIKFPGVNSEHVERLAAVGIKQTEQLFERAKSKQERAKLSKLTGVPGDALLELVKLSDLARAMGVGPVWARLIYEAGIDTMEKLANTSPEEFCDKVRAANDEKQLTKTSLPSEKDIASCVEIWKRLPGVIEY